MSRFPPVLSTLTEIDIYFEQREDCDEGTPNAEMSLRGELASASIRAARLCASVEALGVCGPGYCFCSRDRDPLKPTHEPECADVRAALAAFRGGV